LSFEPFHSPGIPPKPLDPFRFGGDGRPGLQAASPLLRAWASSPARPSGRALATLRSKGCAEPSRALQAALDLAVRRVAEAGLFSPQVGRHPPHTPYRWFSLPLTSHLSKMRLATSCSPLTSHLSKMRLATSCSPLTSHLGFSSFIVERLQATNRVVENRGRSRKITEELSASRLTAPPLARAGLRQHAVGGRKAVSGERGWRRRGPLPRRASSPRGRRVRVRPCPA
jgi:hypothetical protein